MNINFSGRDLKLIICNSLFCATEDLCHQCELYYYYYYYYTRRVRSRGGVDDGRRDDWEKLSDEKSSLRAC